MRRAVVAVAGALLLSGPTALAFFSGGYYAEPRLIAAIAVWALVLALTLTGESPLPRSLPGRLALGGLVLLTLWSALSVSWAPLRGPAIEAVERLVLYVGALLLAVGVLRTRAALRAVEPALAAGATVVIGYGLAGRLLPGIVHLDRSRSAGGRLEQPITYWNAEGALAAIGLVLCARLVADRTRPPRCGSRPPRRRRRSGPASTSPIRAARSRAPCWGSRCSSRWRRRSASCARRRWRSSPARRRPPPPPPCRGSRRSRAPSRSATARSRSSCWRCSPASPRLVAARSGARGSPPAARAAAPAPPPPWWPPRSRWASSPRDWVSGRPRRSWPPAPRRGA